MNVDYNPNSAIPEINFNQRISQVNDYLKEMGMESEYLSNEQAASVFNEIAKDSNGDVNAQDFALALAQQYDSSIKDIDDLDKDYYYALTGIAFADGDGNSFSLEDLELFQKEVEKYTEEKQQENTSATRNDNGVLENAPEYFKQRSSTTASDRIKVDNNGTYYVVADAFNKNKSDNIDCYSRLITNVYGYSYDSEKGKKLMDALLKANPDLENGMQVGERINLVNAQEILNPESVQDKNDEPKTFEDYSSEFDSEIEDDALNTMLNDDNLSNEEKMELLTKAKTNNPEMVEKYLQNDDTFYVNAFIDMVANSEYSIDDIVSFSDNYNEIQGDNKSLNVGSLYADFLKSYVSLYEKAKESDEVDKLEKPTYIAKNIEQSSHLSEDEKTELLRRIALATGYMVHLGRR